MNLLLAQTAHDLALQNLVNTACFILLLYVTFRVGRAVMRSGIAPKRTQKPSEKLLIELEKDYRWRRIKIMYLLAGLGVMLLVAGLAYGADEYTATGFIQPTALYHLERAQDRFWAIGCMFITLGLLWVCYRQWLPRLYVYVKR